MAKLVRAVQKIFASNAGFQQIAQIGSLANGTPNYTTDPVVLQALSEYLDGWFDVSIGANSPAIEDDNALDFLVSRQLAYLFQEGIPEWDALTTYFMGSIAQDGTGGQYLSTLDNNLNNAFNSVGWFPIGTVGPLTAAIGSQTLPANRRIVSPSAITLAASSIVNVPSTTIVTVPDSVIVPTGSSLIVAPGGSVRVI